MAAPATSPARRKRLAALHVAKKDLGLDDEAYRAMLREHTGESSAKDLSDAELDKVLGALRKGGFQRAADDRVRVEEGDEPQLQKIKLMWLQLHERGAAKADTMAALNAWVKRQTGISHVRFLTPDAANVVIESLKAWGGRLRRY